MEGIIFNKITSNELDSHAAYNLGSIEKWIGGYPEHIS